MPVIERIWSKLAANFDAAFNLQSSLIYVPLVLLAALLIEAAHTGYRNSTLSRIGSVNKTDWVLYVVQQLNLGVFIGYAISIGVFYFAVHHLEVASNFIIAPELRLTSVLAHFVAIDFLGYWYHRLMHRIPALWHIHHVHHSAPEFNIINSFRSHPVETTLSRFFMAIPLLALFSPQTASLGAAILAYLLAIKLLNLLQHSQINSDLGWLGNVLVSPAHHRIHHSRDPKHYDKNFGNSFIVWDKLFGTYCTASKAEVGKIEIGLADYDTKSSVIGYLALTYWEFLKALVAPMAKGLRTLLPARRVFSSRTRDPVEDDGAPAGAQ